MPVSQAQSLWERAFVARGEAAPKPAIAVYQVHRMQ
ncbi:hypothetical protein PMI30_02013, partial [Pseudomonas sp. GM50]